MEIPELKLYYCIKPYTLNQVYGFYNPEVYKKFGFSHHNGVDIKTVGTDKNVRAEIKCIHHKSGFQPKGGGIYATYLSTGPYMRQDGKIGYVLIDYLHLERIVTVPGQILEIGDLLAIADNTGATTGEHCHGQYRWVNWNVDKTKLIDMDENDANNSFDPEPYRTGFYAADYTSLSAVLESSEKVIESIAVAPVPVAQKQSWIEALKQAILALFKRS